MRDPGTTPCRRRRLLAATTLLGFAAFTSPGAAQERSDTAAAARRTAWDVTQARGRTREIDFTTSEGTWMAVDISPDGRWLVFDLLGHVYKVATTGGEAVCLTQNSGVAVNYQPRWSPDGRTIAFVSDRRGQDNLWLMDADGSNPRPVFTSLTVRVAEPAWTPDGNYLVVRRTSVGVPGGEGGGGGGLWMYHREGGEGVALATARGSEWPSLSPDGKYLYFHATAGGQGEPLDVLSGGRQIRRLELKSGEIVDVTAGESAGAASSRVSSGGAVAPEVSPDGRWLAFARPVPDGTISYKGHRFGPRSALWLRDLQTGAERLVMDPIETMVGSGSKAIGVLPRYRWASDGRSIVLSQGGRLRRVDVGTGAVTTIPFTARVHRTISEMAYKPFRIEDGPFEAKFLRWHTASPDGRRLAVQAVGRVWVSDLSPAATADGAGDDGATTDDAAEGGAAGAVSGARRVSTPRRLTPAGFAPLEYAPAWSPDGRWLAFTTWDDTGRGHVWKAPAGGGTPVRLTREAAEYIHPVWSPDSRTVVVARGAGGTAHGRAITQDVWFDLVKLPAAGCGAGGCAAELVTTVNRPSGASLSGTARRQLVRPSFGPEDRLFFPEERALRSGTSSENVTQLVSVRLDGSDERVHATFPYADEVVMSPDGAWVAFQEGDNAYITPFSWSGTGAEPFRVDKRRGRFPVLQLSKEGGLFPRWRDSTTVEFGSGNRYFAYDVRTKRSDTASVSLRVPRDVPTGSLALTNARIITLENRQVVERGTVLVRGSRIACVGECDTAGATVIDAAGKTIIPGLIDMHAHHYREHRGIRPRRDYENAIYLAYGVTTNLDNSMWAQNVFPVAELVEAGEAIGPRAFSTGDPLYRGDAARQNEITSYETAEENVRRLVSWGAVSIKQYQQPRRDQRQWISHAAREIGAMVTAEGGDLLYNLGMIMDGQTGFEHPMSYVPLYGDVAKFFGRAKAVYSPTLVVGGPGPWNIEYWFQELDVWKDPKQQRWMPWRLLVPHTRARTKRPATDYSFPLVAQGMADIIAEGGYGALGSHGEHHGAAAQWELWMGAAALGPMGALEVASLHGAHFLGASEDIGSIKVGKLADLLVLDGNPLEDIRHTGAIRYVMKGGVLHEGETLDEVWPRRRPFGPYYWQSEDAFRSDDRPVDWWEQRRR